MWPLWILVGMISASEVDILSFGLVVPRQVPALLVL